MWIMRGHFEELHRAEGLKKFCRVLRVYYIAWYCLLTLLFVLLLVVIICAGRHAS
ncbi:MAG TPA: hypothetical protein VGM54_18735 [Chthoniobacter sp.]